MISTGLIKLDEILNGGIKNGTITDIFGAAGTGKTQLAMQISINSLIEGGKVFFQDTTGEFRPERMLEMITSNQLDSKLLDNVKVTRITNVAEQKNNISKLLEQKDFSLIVIDNVTDLFSFEYSSDSQILEKNLIFMKYMHELSLIAIQKKIPILLTNMIRTIGSLETENLAKAINLFTHVKIGLSKTGSKYFGKVSTLDKNAEFTYSISSKGLLDFP